MTGDDLDNLVQQWLLSIALDGVPTSEAAPPMALHTAIAILGQPSRLLTVGLSRTAAATLAAQMTGMSPAALREDPSLYQDLANEAANVLAGNLWPCLAGATGIGLPDASASNAAIRHELRRTYSLGDEVGLVVVLAERAG
jgi:hypothetical protein